MGLALPPSAESPPKELMRCGMGSRTMAWGDATAESSLSRVAPARPLPSLPSSHVPLWWPLPFFPLPLRGSRAAADGRRCQNSAIRFR